MDPNKLRVQVVDMDADMQAAAGEQILEAFENHTSESVIAKNIKAYFDKQYDPSWNVIVGKNFGSHVINQTKCYMFATYCNDEMSILLWKS